MWYLGSKTRIAKELVPIIQSFISAKTKGYIEPFVGGANIIDKIKFENKMGGDVHAELIALLKYLQSNPKNLPKEISNETYTKVRFAKETYPAWYVGLVGFCGSFGAKYFGGYARNNEGYDKPFQSINNLKKQAPNLKGIKFFNVSYEYWSNFENCVIYCDPPYKGTTKYSTKNFNYEAFYDWCRKMAINNTVLISEYEMPNDFECIWEKESSVNFDSNRGGKQKRIEKLFIAKPK